MLRTCVALVVLVIASVNIYPASAAQYRDPQARFTLTLPDGWVTEKPDNSEQLALVMSVQGVADAKPKGLCLVIVIDVPDTKSASQADINAAIDEQLTPDFWKLALQSSGSKNIVLDSSGSREKNGRKIHHVILTGTMENEGVVTQNKGKQELHAIPGSFQLVACLADAAKFESVSADFETIFNSYEPKSGEYIARAPQSSPSVLTLYSGANYDGTARVLSQDTASLAASGWGTTAASLVVDGAQSWEVCEGADFTGKCRTIVAAHSDVTVGMPVGSVRRVYAPHNLAGALSTAIRRSLLETLHQTKKR